MVQYKRSVIAAILFSVFAVYTSRSDGKQEAIQNEANAVESNAVESTVTIPFGWKVGDRKRFAVSRTDYKAGNADAIAKQSRFDIEIKSEKDEQLVARCVLSIVVSESQRKQADPISRQLIDLYDELPIEVIISNQGELVGVSDASELEAAVNKTKAMVYKIVDQLDIDAEKKEAVKKISEETRSLAQIQQQMLAPLSILLMMTNTTHSLAQPAIAPSTTDLLFAQDVPTNETYEVVGVDQKNGLVSLRYTQVVEGEPAATMVQESLFAFAKRMQPDREPAPLTIKGTISHAVADVAIDLETGWASSAQWKTQMNNLKDGRLQMKQLLTINAIRDLPIVDR